MKKRIVAEDGGKVTAVQTKRFSTVTQLCCLLSAVCCLIYANTLFNGYAIDDPVMIEKNKFVTQGLQAIPRLFATPHLRGFYEIPNDLYRPLSLVMFAIEYQFFGLSPVTGHLLNVLVYTADVLLLFIFLNCLFEQKKTGLAFLAALLFAVHPIHTEVVANIKSRDELLCFCFSFLSLNVFIRYMKDGGALKLAGAAISLFLACLSKETAVTFVAVIPFVFFFYANDSRKRAIHISLAAITATILFIGIRSYVLGKYNTGHMIPPGFADNSLAYASGYSTRFATEINILGRYLKLLFVPYPLLCDYAYNSIPYSGAGSLGFLLSLAAYCSLIVIAIKRWAKQKNDPWVFCIVFFLVTLFIVSNIPFLISGEMAERFLFFPSVGFCLAAALATQQWLVTAPLSDIAPLKNKTVMAVLVPVLLLFSIMTIARNTAWKDDYTLFKTDVERSPNDSRLHHHLAAAIQLMANNETDSIQKRSLNDIATTEYKKALAIYPAYIATLSDLSHLYYNMKMNDSAEVYFKRFLEVDTGGDKGANTIAANIIANIDFNAGRFEQALLYFRTALAISPEISYSYMNVAETFIRLNKFDSAIAYMYKALAVDTTYTGEHVKLASAFMKMNNLDSAVSHYRQHLALHHFDAASTNEFGIFYFNLRMYPQAMEQFKKTIETAPGFISAYANLGTCYFITGKFDFAVSVFRQELRVAPNNVQDLPYLAVSYLRAGQKDSAAKYEAIIQQTNPNFRLPK